MRQSRPARCKTWFFGPVVLAGLSALMIFLPANVGGASAAIGDPGAGQYPAHIRATSSLGNAADATALAANTARGLPAGGVLGDVNGDGIADILAIDAAGNLWLYPNTDSGDRNMFGGFRSQVGTGWTGYTVEAVAPLYGLSWAGILAKDTAGNLWYYLNIGGTGTATFSGRIQVGTGWSGYTVVGLTDLYSTSQPGILAIDAAGSLWYYPNTGDTALHTFGARARVGAGWAGYTADVADINGDGHPDILAVDSSGTMWLYPNTLGTGTSVFGARSKVGSGWSGYRAVDVGTLISGGADADILACDASGNLWYYRNTGGSSIGTFASPVQVGTGWTAYTIN